MHKKNMYKAIVSFAVAMAFIMPGSAMFTDDHGVISPSGTMTIEWEVTLYFNEPGGMSDYVIFGEAPDACDGPTGSGASGNDIYDAPKPPLPMPPYLRAWFDDGLSSPYHNLWEDYRMYPDTFKVWDLYVRWKSSDDTPINIDMNWDISEFIGIEYGYITLNRYNRSTEEWDFAADMLTENYYTYAPEYFMEQWLTDHFQINAYINRPPYIPSSSDPADGAIDVDVDAILVWSGGDPDFGDTVTYDVYFGTTSPPPHVVWNQSGTMYDPGTMNYNIQYFWKIVAWDNHDVSTEGPIWNFTTQAQPNDPPYIPSIPFPINHATEIDIDIDLSWSGGDPDFGDTVTYDVYFGTTSPPPHVVWNQSDASYDPGSLDYETKYYWQIVAWDNHDAYATGPIWDFTTDELFVGWECQFDFTEPDGGYDNVFFGEKTDASDGQDIYDVPKSPPGMTPYIRAWFDTSFHDPHNKLWKEYKYYPDDYNIWNLSVQWVPDDYTSPTNITISWNSSCLNTVEYNSTRLKNTASGETVNMLLNENYTFNASALTIHHFQIICSNEIHIANLQSKWNMVSLPFNQFVLNDDIIVRYDDVDYSWENATTGNNPTGESIVLRYIYFWNTSIPQHYDLSDVFEPGYGYWMYAYHDCELWTEDFGSTINEWYITDLLTTWNLMGVPNDVPLPKEDLIVCYNGVDYSWENATTGNNPTGGSIVLRYIYCWNTSIPQHYDLSDVFEPGYGYWMYAYHDCTLRREIFVPIIIDNSPDTACTGNSFVFNASVSDSDGIDSVWVEYWFGVGGHTNDFMTPTGVDDYYEKAITIPSDSVDPLYYVISANDSFDVWSNTGEQTVTVIDDDAPKYSWILKPEVGTTGESVLVNVSVTDNIGVTYYKIIVDSVEYDMDNYTYVINIPENSIADIIYNCTFKDAHGNTVGTEDVTITVTDNDRPEISNVLATPPSTIQDGYVNITCDVTDNVDVDAVMVNIIGPAGFTPVNTTMNEYYNTSYSIAGTYFYFIWANDTSNNTNTSATYDFYIYDSTIVYIDDDYNSSTPGWGYDRFDMIQNGINAVAENGMVLVNDGIYNENILVNKELTIKSSSSPVIDGQGMFGPAINIQAENVILQGFIIKNFTATPTAYIGAILVEGNNTTINSNTIENITSAEDNPAGIGIDVHAKDVQITNNTVRDVGSIGIRVRHDWNTPSTESNNVLIENNTVYRTNNTGVLVTGYAKGITIRNNVIYDSIMPTPYNLFVHYGAENVTIEDNDIYNTYSNVVLGGCNNITISNNTIADTIADPSPGKNIYILNDYANWTGDVDLLSTNVDIINNNIMNGSYGIRIINAGATDPSQMASTTTINYNNIYDNTDYGVENMIGTNINAEYNWWGDPSGPYHPATNSDGLGDNVSDNVRYIPWLDVQYPGGNPTSNPPEISNIVSNPESQVVDKFVNITCDVTDDLGVDTVKVNITGPVGFTPVNTTMNDGSYYYNTSYSIVGTYSYFIWANDTTCKSNTSDMYTFSIIASLLLVDSEFNYNADDLTTRNMWHMDTDNNVITPLSNGDYSHLVEGNMFDSMWYVTLEFTEPDGGYDNVFFGEKTDASDGQDIYDVPKSPPGMTPYIRAWFDTSFHDPHNKLWKEYKQYPDDYNIWNLSVQWVPSDSISSTDVTISWNINDIDSSEYNSVVLYDVLASNVVADMLVDTYYTFNASAMMPKDFEIICSINEPPISDLDCDGTLDWTNVTPGSTVTDSFTVENIGDPGSELDWEIESYPNWGTWTFTPSSGNDLTPEDDPVTVSVSVVAPDESETEFTGEVKIVNSDDPDDFCIIDVSLATPVSQNSVFLQFLERLMDRFPMLERILSSLAEYLSLK